MLWMSNKICQTLRDKREYDVYKFLAVMTFSPLIYSFYKKNIIIFIYSSDYIINTMSLSNLTISPKIIQDFCDFIAKSSSEEFIQVISFYHEVISPIFANKHNKSSMLAFETSIKRYFDIIQKKISQIPILEDLYPEISIILSNIQMNLKVKRKFNVNRNQEHKELNQKDKNFQNFIKDQQNKLQTNSNNSIFKEQESQAMMGMSVLISSERFNNKWQFLIYQSRDHFRHLKDQKDQKDQKDEKKKNRIMINKQIIAKALENHYVNVYCLGCTQLFYEKVDFFEYGLTKTDFILAKYSIHDISMEENRIKKAICALLNSRGGVILFDCCESYMKIYPQGAFINQKMKEQISQKISTMFAYFYPNIKFDIHVQLTFIPVAQRPSKLSSDKLNFKPGQYVTRLRICNNQSSQRNKIYLYSKDKDKSEYGAFYRQNGQTKLLKKRHLIKYIKRRYQDYAIPVFNPHQLLQKQLVKQAVLTRPIHSFHDHACPLPLAGNISEAIYKETKSAPQSQFYLELQYKHTSMLFLHSESNTEVTKFFKKKLYSNNQRGDNLKFQLIQPSQKYKFYDLRTDNNLCLFFHYVSVDDVKTIIRQYNKQQTSKATKRNKLVHLSLQYCLKLQDNLSESQFKEIMSFLKGISINQMLKYYEVKEPKGYYLLSEEKVTIFYVFTKLTLMQFKNNNLQHKSKSYFQALNPKFELAKLDD